MRIDVFGVKKISVGYLPVPNVGKAHELPVFLIKFNMNAVLYFCGSSDIQYFGSFSGQRDVDVGADDADPVGSKKSLKWHIGSVFF